MPFTTPVLGINVEATGADKIVYFNFFLLLFFSRTTFGLFLIFFASEIFGLYFVIIFTISVFIIVSFFFS